MNYYIASLIRITKSTNPFTLWLYHYLNDKESEIYSFSCEFVISYIHTLQAHHQIDLSTTVSSLVVNIRTLSPGLKIIL